MSRSIHENRSARYQTLKGYIDGEEILADYEKVFRKRRLKRVSRQRRKGAPSGLPPITSASFPVDIKEADPNFFFPPSEDDLREVLDALPLGTLDGLSKVVVEAGTSYINSHGEKEIYKSEEFIRDPFLGRLSVEIIQGVYEPSVKGGYDLEDNSLWLFGYSKESEAEISLVELIAIELSILMTLMHEIAHHYDWVRRVARGRWFMDDPVKCEEYAWEFEQEWLENILKPYLQKKYRKE
jgi:hypothetical protein